MLLSVVSVLVVAQSSSKVPKGLMNNPVYCIYFDYRQQFTQGIHNAGSTACQFMSTVIQQTWSGLA